MKLYHGTSGRHLQSILSKGIKPRGRKKGNWKDFPSRQDMVYLTTAYAPYFAIQSCKKEDERALIVEVELDPIKLYPDEDFIVQVLAMKENRSIEHFHDDVRENLELYQHHALDSLGGLGNCSHKTAVPASSISRYCLIDCQKRRDLAMMCMDPSISLMNYRFCGERYRSLIAWLFGDRHDFVLSIADNESHIQMMERVQPGFRKLVEDSFSNREGIEVYGFPERIES